MKSISRSLAFICIVGILTAGAQAADPTLTMNLWPGLPPGDKPNMGDEKWNDTTKTITGVVATPTLAVYRPDKDKDTGAAIIVAPGGGFYQLSMGHEGADVAQWLASIGVTGIVLKYRIPQRDGMPRYMAGFQDGQRAMSVVRSKAGEWGIDPHRIGFLGFSAGGQVGADVETNFDKRMYEPVDDMDKADTRPDFAVLIYPGGIVPKRSDVPALTDDVKVSKDTPPTFLAIADNDRNGPENAVYMYLALKKAGVSAELHVYSEGGHGFGIRPGTAPHTTWPARVQDWMAFHGFLKSTKAQ
jgi:acetyl esterase/lipase